jgi:hypothetical protein
VCAVLCESESGGSVIYRWGGEKCRRKRFFR